MSLDSFNRLDIELPKATSTSALSSAGVMRLFNKVGETVNKITYKMDETDPVSSVSAFEFIYRQIMPCFSDECSLLDNCVNLTSNRPTFSCNCFTFSREIVFDNRL